MVLESLNWGASLLNHYNLQILLCQLTTYLYILNNIFEGRGALHTHVHHVHCPVKVLYILSIHLQKRSKFLQDISQPWVDTPVVKRQVSTEISGNQWYLQRENTAGRFPQLSPTCTSIYTYVQSRLAKFSLSNLYNILDETSNMNPDVQGVTFPPSLS